MGSRPFSGEIAASAATAVASGDHPSSRTLFVRAVRKLLMRFNPVLWEGEAKASKLSPLLRSVEEGLDLFEGLTPGNAAYAKAAENLVKDCHDLLAEGSGAYIPINQIRRAASWARLAPVGKGKFLLIENADRMQEGARNSLLKLLEEPPERVTIVLSSSRPAALLQTILSRLRPVEFAARSEGEEREVLRRVFRAPESASPSVAAYLESFLPVSDGELESDAAFFAASVAMKAVIGAQSRGKEPPLEIVALGKYAAPLAEAAGFGRPLVSSKDAVAAVVKKADSFAVPQLFTRFLKALLMTAQKSQAGAVQNPSRIAYNEIWRECAAEAESAVSIYYQKPAAALERFFLDAAGKFERCGHL
jgi:DNA polymerase-3 subunit gamma/tau